MGGLEDSLVVEDVFGHLVFCPDVAHLWKEVGFVEVESGGLPVTGRLPLPDLLPPPLRSHGGSLPGEAAAAPVPWEINDQATFSQPFPEWTVTLWPGLGSYLGDMIC